MSRVNTIGNPTAFVDWVQKNHEQIATHPAWHSKISENESETLLRGNPPFTYLLRSGEKEHLYFISFIKGDGSIKHQFFVLEFDRKGWLYRNGGTGSPQEIVSKDLHQLIPMMMHCDLLSCTPLTST